MSNTCECCGAYLGPPTGRGRPRKYCDDKCRRDAWRARRGVPSAAGPPGSGAPEPAASAGDEVLAQILKDLQEGARDLQRILLSGDGEEPLRRITQMQQQLDGLTAGAVGRARHRKVTWNKISSILGISEDTTRHRFTDRYILRRAARFARSRQLPNSVAALFSSPASPAAANGASGAPRPPEPGDSAPAPPPGDDADVSEPPQGPASRAAYNRLAPILSMLIRTSQRTNKEVSEKIGCSASYLSRILSGERVPTWELTRRFAQVCGADPAVLRRVWESQKLSESNRDATVVDRSEVTMPATRRLRIAVETLHMKAGSPAPQDLAVASRWSLGITETASLLEGEVLPDEQVLWRFVRLLGGDTTYFTDLLSAARLEADTAAAVAAEGHPAVGEAPADSGIHQVMTTFRPVLTTQDTVQDGRARILQRMAEKKQDGEEEQPSLLMHKLASMRTHAAGLTRRTATRPTWT
ncbi:helix-turn-helix domain-containing protein [Streptomyces globosus]|uniref:helix-turn-helix domain-containing protein n=1 Tax=Streptomyces globosus TaxID=68209 RepID=UPI0031D83E81